MKIESQMKLLGAVIFFFCNTPVAFSMVPMEASMKSPIVSDLASVRSALVSPLQIVGFEIIDSDGGICKVALEELSESSIHVLESLGKEQGISFGTMDKSPYPVCDPEFVNLLEQPIPIEKSLFAGPVTGTLALSCVFGGVAGFVDGRFRKKEDGPARWASPLVYGGAGGWFAKLLMGGPSAVVVGTAIFCSYLGQELAIRLNAEPRVFLGR